LYPVNGFVGYMREIIVDLIPTVTQQLLNLADAGARLNQLCGKRMAQIMHRALWSFQVFGF